MAGFLSWWDRNESRLGVWASLLGIPTLLAGGILWWLAAPAREMVLAGSWVLLCVGGFVSSLAYASRIRRRFKAKLRKVKQGVSKLRRKVRRARYAEILPHLRTAVRSILAESLRSHTVDEQKAVLAKVMDEVAKAFSILTGSSCRACVKVCRNKRGNKELQASTFCRHSAERHTGDDHPVAHNTDFNDLYQDHSKKWFFGNDLPAMAGEKGYNNTSMGWIEKYRATLVWPIRSLTDNPQATPTLLGFLCVDSKMAQAFSEEFDYEVGAIVADTLSPFLEAVATSPRTPSAAKVQATEVPAELGEPNQGEGKAT
jgi:hypothetical protein